MLFADSYTRSLVLLIFSQVDDFSLLWQLISWDRGWKDNTAKPFMTSSPQNELRAQNPPLGRSCSRTGKAWSSRPLSRCGSYHSGSHISCPM